jgi:phosphosulfolactate phosphohydrolase-like enzyme
MTPPRRTVVIDAFCDSAFRHRGRAALACIDVMLATTTIATAAAQGHAVRVAGSLEEWRALVARTAGAVPAGHAEGVPPGSFAASDGPCALGRLPRDGRALVLLSPPGTELLAHASAGACALVACFRNLSATAEALARHDRVALLAAGFHEEFSCEDQMAAAWIAARLLDRGFEAEDRFTAGVVRRWSKVSPQLAGWGNGAAALRRAGRSDEVDFVLGHVDDLAEPCACEGGRVGSPLAAAAEVA